MDQTEQKKCRYCSSAITKEMIFGKTIICGTCGSAEREEAKMGRATKATLIGLGGVALLTAIFFLKTPVMVVLNPESAFETMSFEDAQGAKEKCLRGRNSKCLIAAYKRLVQLDKTDVFSKANLAFELTDAKRFAEADPIYSEILHSGVGTYDLMAYYGNNLEGQERYDEAAKWFEKALEIKPNLLDITSKLARVYIKTERSVEAVSLLQSFSKAYPEAAMGLAGDISASLERIPHAKETDSLKLISVGSDHFNIPIQMTADSSAQMFLMDTGASIVTIPTKDAEKYYAKLMTSSQVGVGILANGSKIKVNRMVVPTLQIGPWKFENVDVAYCDKCERLAGMSLLKNMQLTAATKGRISTIELRR